jgi:hypothetical protein
MPKYHLTHADRLFWGGGHHPGIFNDLGRKGMEITPIVKIDLGAPLTLDTNGLIVAATSTELPDTETVTYTFPATSSSPQDGANLTGIMDVPRNITSVTTHGSSIVAMTILVTGTDTYGEAMSELITVAATGTSEIDDGIKAFKTVTSIAITAAADAEANTLNMGFGDVLGLPYKLEGEYDVLAQYADTTEEKLASVWVAAVATDPATTTTGDVRGTVNPDTACDGSVNYYVWMKVDDVSTKTGLGGVLQA